MGTERKKEVKVGTKKEVKIQSLLPGLESEAFKTTIDLFSMFMSQRQLDFINSTLNSKAELTNGTLKSNFKKVITYLNSLNEIKQSNKNVKIPRQSRPPKIVEEVTKNEIFAETNPVRAESTFVQASIPGKGAAPNTKTSLVVADEVNVTKTRKINPKKVVEVLDLSLLEKLGKSEVEKYEKLAVGSSFPYVKIVQLGKEITSPKVVVVGTAMGYKGNDYYNINCTVNEVMVGSSDNPLILQEASNRRCLYSSKKVVAGKTKQEERYIRLLKYEEGMEIRYWMHNLTENKDVSKQKLKINNNKIEIAMETTSPSSAAKRFLTSK